MALPAVQCADTAAALRQAFGSGRTAGLNNLLPDGGRIYMAIPAVGINSGSYGKAQALALLRKAFARYKTVSFSLTTADGAIRGDWVVNDTATGQKKSLTVYVSVEQRGGRAVITSIRGG